MALNNKTQRFKLSFEWHSLVRDLLRNIWLVALAASIGFMAIYVGEHSVYTPAYTSSTTLVVRSKAGTNGAHTNLTVSAEMAEVFATVFSEPTMRQKAAENIGMKSFRGEVTTEVMEGINLMTVSVTAHDPVLAYEQLKSILEVYPEISDVVFTDAVIDVLIWPQMPTSPSDTLSTKYRGIAVGGAAAVMVVLIALLSMLRDTVKHEKSFETNIDAKLLGTIVHEKPHLTMKERLARKKRSLLIDDAYSSLRFAEDYQNVATKLEYMYRHQNSKIFAITSVAENEGKSTAAANIALALAGRGFRVMLIDIDIRKPSIYKIFGCSAKQEHEFSDVLSGKLSPKEFKFQQYKKSGLYLALNRHYRSDAAQWLGSEMVSKCIKSIGEWMDFVIIDTPPVAASADAASLVGMCDKTLLVVRTDTVDITDINDTVMTINNIGNNLAGCILNDLYRPFTMFGQIGLDESSAYSYKHGYYKRYGYGPYALSEVMFDDEE